MRCGTIWIDSNPIVTWNKIKEHFYALLQHPHGTIYKTKEDAMPGERSH